MARFPFIRCAEPLWVYLGRVFHVYKRNFLDIIVQTAFDQEPSSSY